MVIVWSKIIHMYPRLSQFYVYSVVMFVFITLLLFFFSSLSKTSMNESKWSFFSLFHLLSRISDLFTLRYSVIDDEFLLFP